MSCSAALGARSGAGMATSTIPAARERSRSRLGRLSVAAARPQALIIGGVIAFVAYLALVPLYYLIHETLTGAGGFSLDVFARAYGGNSQSGRMIKNSLVFAGGSTILSLAVGTVLAYVQVRTDAPLKGLFFAASLVPLIIPAILYSVAWIFLADAKIGMLNTLVAQPVTAHHPFSIYSMSGMIWVQGLHNAPVAFLLMVAAFRLMDPSLEESAQMCGGSRLAVLRRVTLPLLRPAIVASVLLLFVHSLEGFEVPAVLGLQSGIYVFTSRIYYQLNSFPIDYGVAGAYSMGLLIIAIVGILLSRWLSKETRQYQTVTGKAFRPRPVSLGRARPFVGAATVVYFGVTVLLPVLTLFYGSLLTYYRPPSREALGSFSFDTYASIIHDSTAVTALKNTILLGLGAATVVMLATAVSSWFVVRTHAPGRGALDALLFIPLVIPGIVLGLAVSFVYLRTPFPIYGTLWIILIAYVTRYLPYGMRYSGAAMAQTSSELEESAYVSGASWWQTFRRILMPLASSGIVAGWIYVLIVSFRELSSTILLYSPGKETLAVLIFERFENGDLTEVAALGILMVVFLVILVLAAYRLGGRVGVKNDVIA